MKFNRAADFLEAGALFLLILFYIWWLRFRFPWAWMVIYGFVLCCHIRRRETPAALGFRTQGFRRCLRRFGPSLVLTCAAILAAGAVFHTLRNVGWKPAIGTLLLSCCWGLFQQYLLNGFFLNRVHSPLVAALLFSGVHAPNWFLMVVTLAGGWCAAGTYQRYRNLPFLGLAHGLISVAIYLSIPDSISHHLYVGPRY